MDSSGLISSQPLKMFLRYKTEAWALYSGARSDRIGAFLHFEVRELGCRSGAP